MEDSLDPEDPPPTRKPCYYASKHWPHNPACTNNTSSNSADPLPHRSRKDLRKQHHSQRVQPTTAYALQRSQRNQLVHILRKATAYASSEEEGESDDVCVLPTNDVGERGEEDCTAEVGKCVGEGYPVYVGERAEVSADCEESCAND